MPQTDERKTRRAELYGLMGRLPGRDNPIKVKKVSEKDCGSYRLETLVLTIETGADEPAEEPIAAYFARPKGKEKCPAVLFNHSHGGQFALGKDELLHPSPYMYCTPYAEALTALGYGVLCIDQWCFGDRSGRNEGNVFKEMLWKGEYLWGRRVYDTLRALDYLCSRHDVDESRIAVMGMSMGSTMSCWVAALDERVKVCVDICCLTDFDALIARDDLDQHGFYYYIPDLIRHFSAAQINGLIAPRAHLGTVGRYDRLTPPEGVDRIEREVRAFYAAVGAGDKFSLLRYPVAHRESAEMRSDILAYLKKTL